MGVLGDDDIEKLNENQKKRSTWKVFHDPVKASNLWTFTFAALLIVGTIAVMAISFTATVLDLSNENKKLYENLKIAVLDNSDCASLVSIYKNIDGEVTWLKQSIKDEIKFRCD